MSPPPLDTFTKSVLEEYRFPGTDAAVIFIPGEEIPSAEVQGVLQRSSQQRWYPVPGGHQAKVPWHFSRGHEALFEREKKGWDHEHCDFCDTHVCIGEVCWTGKSGQGIWIFCKKCYDSLRQGEA